MAGKLSKSILKFPFLEFKRANSPVVVLLAGFPDNVLSGWENGFLEALKSKYHVVALCLPDYDKDKETIPWGADFDELVSGMNHTMNSVISTDQRFYLIAHDWGSVVAQMYENQYPERVKKLVLLDVGRGVDTSIKGLFVAVFYQLGFASNYLISKIFGETIGNITFRLFCGLTPRFLWPVPYDKMNRRAKDIGVHLCYPYYYLWKRVFTLSPIRITFPRCPVLFLYGTKKNCMFHDAKFLKKLDSTEGCKHLSLDSGHWVTNFQPTICYNEISNFCEDK